MAEIVNLRLARKKKARTDKEVRASQNRVAFGRTRAERDVAQGRERHRRSAASISTGATTRPNDMSGGILKRSVAIAGHRTSISLEEPFWEALREMAERESISVQRLIGRIDAERGDQNLSSAIRVYIVDRLRGDLSRPAEPELRAEA